MGISPLTRERLINVSGQAEWSDAPAPAPLPSQNNDLDCQQYQQGSK